MTPEWVRDAQADADAEYHQWIFDHGRCPNCEARNLDPDLIPDDYDPMDVIAIYFCDVCSEQWEVRMP